eukprot:Amastigsp_a847562_9.p4 type:complete len:116 gc:universal Amastigsp_a847562_9:789-442(-)
MTARTLSRGASSTVLDRRMVSAKRSPTPLCSRSWTSSTTGCSPSCSGIFDLSELSPAMIAEKEFGERTQNTVPRPQSARSQAIAHSVATNTPQCMFVLEQQRSPLGRMPQSIRLK